MDKLKYKLIDFFISVVLVVVVFFIIQEVLFATSNVLSIFMVPLLGLYYGLSGALGVAVGHAIYRTLLYGLDFTSLYQNSMWSIALFVLACISYIGYNSKIFNFSDSDEKSHSLKFSGIIKFAFLISLATLISVFILVLLITVCNFQDLSYMSYIEIKRLTLEGIAVNLIIGTPFIIWFSRKNFNKYLHKNKENFFELPIYYHICMVSCMLFFIHLSFVLIRMSMEGEYSTIVDVNGRNIVQGFVFEDIIVSYVMLLVWLYIAERLIAKPLQLILSQVGSIAVFNKNRGILDFSELSDIHSNDEIGTLANTIKKMSEDIEANVKNLQDDIIEKENKNTELGAALRIQQSYLPKDIRFNDMVPEIAISSVMKPAKEVGADFYDYGAIDEDHVYVMVSDILGKGVPAALFMSMVCTTIRSIVQEEANPQVVITESNNKLVVNNKEKMYVTCFFAVYEISTGKLTYVNANHTNPIVIRSEGETEYVYEKSKAVLAAKEGEVYQQYEMYLQKGDVLLMFTDGVVTAEDEREEIFGYGRLMNVARSLVTPKKRSKAVNTIYETIELFSENIQQSDDITMLGLYVK